MAMFLMFGKYTTDGLKGISAERTREAEALLDRHGGRVSAAYAMLGECDLVLIVDLPDTAHAMKASVALTRQFGIAFTTAPAVPVEEFDAIVKAV